MSVPFFQVDVFATVPFEGNPAAVCVLPGEAEPRWMQQVASEMNLSDTAFVHPRGDALGLRWFTPTVEVDLCGHATLASAHVLWETGRLAADADAHFRTRSGLLTAARDGDWIELDLPATPARAVPVPSGLAEALGLDPRFVGQSEFDYLVEVDTEEDVRNVRPDLARLRRLGGRGVIVTSQSSRPDTDIVSRFFAPAAGIDEDPVTGSAHCCLAPYWQTRLDRDTLIARQVSARGGILKVRVQDDRVRVAGQAVTVVRGELLV